MLQVCNSINSLYTIWTKAFKRVMMRIAEMAEQIIKVMVLMTCLRFEHEVLLACQ